MRHRRRMVIVSDPEELSNIPRPRTSAFNMSWSFVHFDYLRQRLSQEYSLSTGDIVDPEFLLRQVPPEVVEQLQRVDWESIDLALAIALVFRMVWIWDVRCEQLNEWVWLVGDEELYRRLRGALLNLLRRHFAYAPLLELADELAPSQLPSYRHEACRDRSFQSRIRGNFELLASKIATLADRLSMKSESTDTTPILYSFDRALGWYRMDATRLIEKKGRSASNLRSQAPKDIVSLRFRNYRRIRIRRAVQADAGINVAIFAATRIERLWKGIVMSPAIPAPTEEQQSTYTHEHIVIFNALYLNSKYHDLLIRSFSMIPQYLQKRADSPSFRMAALQAHEGILYAIGEFRREALRLEEAVEIVDWRKLESDWYPDHQLERYSRIIAALLEHQDSQASDVAIDEVNDAIATSDSELTMSFPPTEFADEPAIKGRPAVQVSFEEAVAVWWELSDEYAPRKPTQEDVCDRLAERGTHIAVRTLRQRIYNWRQEGHRWPGPRPDAEKA